MRLHLVDGTFELFRSHYSRRPGRTAPDGQDVKATVGVLDALLSLLEDEDEQVTHLGVAFDNPIESWRNDRFPDYKDGSGVEEALLAQFDLVEEAVASLGVVVWSMDTQEADDALAAAALRWRDEVEQVRILTPDKDLGQVVDGQRIVQVDRMRGRQFDEAGVVERLGVPPASVPDYLALVGDTADGIPGLKGFGAKSTATLLTRYGHLEAIPRDGDWDVTVRGAAGLARTFDQQFDDALLYRELATLVRDVPLGTGGAEPELADLEHRGVPREAFEATCDRLGLTTMRERPRRWR